MLFGQDVGELQYAFGAGEILAVAERRVRTRLVFADQALARRNCRAASTAVQGAYLWFQTLLRERQGAGLQPFDERTRDLLKKVALARVKVRSRCGGA